MEKSTVELEKLRSTFFEEADLVISILDKNLDFIDVNQTLLKTFNFKREDIIGKNIKQISPDIETSGRLELYKEVLRTGKTHVIEEVKSHPSFGNFYFRVKIFKVGDYLGFISKDITDLKNAIEELQTFIYKSSHDMRAPIASILGLMSLGNDAKSLEEVQELYEMGKKQMEKLDSIHKDLITSTRIQTIEKAIQNIQFKEIVDQVLDSLRFTSGFQKVIVKKNITGNQKFYSDKQLLVSLFQNLIDNAIKYKKENNPDSFVNVSVLDYNDGVKIIIADNGIGIPDNMQNDVFKMFFRGASTKSGSGLGLYTVSHTIKKLGGSIKLDSKEKIGTTFTVFIPNGNLPN